MRRLATSLMASAGLVTILFHVGTAQGAVTTAGVVKHYADIAQAKYEDSLIAGKALDKAIDAFLTKPDKGSFELAKKAWLASRVPYQQTEVYRFGNAIVDDWEGKVNAWPLDEGLIDYVDASYGKDSPENTLYTANVIANVKITIDGKEVDASKITPDFLETKLQEAGGVEANVATGYHAIEFLLWGQDLNGTGKGAGKRSYTDFSLENCTGGNCERRRQYLAAASDLLVRDLEEMAANWTSGGAARKALEEAGPKGGLRAMLTGMGSLSYGELAGERMKLGLMLGDPEEEHDCFADNTHNSHYYDALGIQNIYLGKYTRLNGKKITGPSLSALVASKDAALDKEMRVKLGTTISAMSAMVKRAEKGEAYDQMIGKGNKQGNAVVQKAIDGLVDQTKSIERVINVLALGKIELEGSDSLDNPSKVFE